MSNKSSTKNILVIGGLSEDDIQLVDKTLSSGETTIVTLRHRTLGGRGCNVALSAFRSSHTTPPGGIVDPNQPHRQYDGSDLFDVHVIGAVADEHWKSRFTQHLCDSGVRTEGITLLERLEDDEAEGRLPGQPVEQDFCTSRMDSKSGEANQTVGFEASSQWSIAQFPDIDTICPSYTPNLVIVTMELKKALVEHIIDISHDAGVDVLVYASPGETLSLDHYRKITHLVCNQHDAAKMLGRKSDEVNVDTWPEICANFQNKGIGNVVLKCGIAGMYYKNEQVEGYVSGYRPINEITDQTGSTASFVGTYAVEYLKSRAANPSSTSTDWDIGYAVTRGTQASDFVVTEVGYATGVPWLDQLNKFDTAPLYADREDYKEKSKKVGKKVFKWRGKTLSEDMTKKGD